MLELPAVPEPLEAIDAFPAPDEAPAAPPPLPAAPPAAPPALEQAPVLAREEPALAAAAILETPSAAWANAALLLGWSQGAKAVGITTEIIVAVFQRARGS